MRIHKTKVYQFNELSEESKEKALEENRDYYTEFDSYEWMQADEYLSEGFEANETEFTEEGKIF
jgi:hypothetical protein